MRKKITVKGVVQGVGFRYFTFNAAIELGIRGYAKNLINGNVEVVAEGNDEAVLRLIEYLKQGSRLSRVDELIVETVKEDEEYLSFTIRN